ncbi:MAG: BrxA/BrxB family bacilliredoxin [Gemmatimonadetes bacterium]|nr:BrxA/BrxB family bacilliredoxin [Gemmatimonadota bacterium]MCH8144167.1 BrxA/BrxB family bacilliredoxin [Gemmatimonadota bacterium]
MVQPMREELTTLGFEELLTPDAVDEVLGSDGVVLVVVNSVCGCAAGKARPGVRLAVQHDKVPDKLTTVFAGMEIEATERARSYFTGYPPSSPQIGLLKDGKLVYLMERHDIEGREANEIAAKLVDAFDQYCGKLV